MFSQYLLQCRAETGIGRRGLFEQRAKGREGQRRAQDLFRQGQQDLCHRPVGGAGDLLQ